MAAINKLPLEVIDGIDTVSRERIDQAQAGNFSLLIDSILTTPFYGRPNADRLVELSSGDQTEPDTGAILQALATFNPISPDLFAEMLHRDLRR